MGNEMSKKAFYMIVFAKANEVIEKKRAGYNVTIDFESLKRTVEEYIAFCKTNNIACGDINMENFESEIQIFILNELSEFYSKR